MEHSLGMISVEFSQSFHGSFRMFVQQSVQVPDASLEIHLQDLIHYFSSEYVVPLDVIEDFILFEVLDNFLGFQQH